LKENELYNEDLAPIPPGKRTWNKWHLAALWVGVAVCIPTYILASYMIKSGLSWQAALIIITAANLFITIPMVLNGYAGVKYGIPFPVYGRASFGVRGVHLPALLRSVVACGWFGVQTWIGGLAVYSVFTIITGQQFATGLNAEKFICFFLFWLLNIYFIWKGTEHIKRLENFAAPVLIFIGLLLIFWGYQQVNSFPIVLEQSPQLGKPLALREKVQEKSVIVLQPIADANGMNKADEYRITNDKNAADGNWSALEKRGSTLVPLTDELDVGFVQLRKKVAGGEAYIYSSIQPIQEAVVNNSQSWWNYLLWFTAMVGFWATMSISISDITRFAKSQKDQVAGQFIGLPGTMLFYSFVGIFVTCAAVIAFNDVLIAEDAPWDPVNLVSKFEQKYLVLFAQLALIMATLSTNIAANVIAPAYAISNLYPKKISFRWGGIIAGLAGIAMCPWLLLDSIGSILIFISGLLGPIVGIMLCDYFIIRKRNLNINHLYSRQGEYGYGGSGINYKAVLALVAGISVALIGRWVPQLDFLFTLSWFTGFIVAFILYMVLMKKDPHADKQETSQEIEQPQMIAS
jgi:cytosine/uracil/thiamine/allantoin permease